MNASPESQYYWDMLRSYCSGRKFVLARGPLAGHAKFVELLHELGALSPLLLPAGQGIGALPDPSLCSWHMLDFAGASFSASINDYTQRLQNLPEAARAAVEDYDPLREAHVIGSHIFDIGRLLGRPQLGARDRAWIQLEDKVVIDSFWDRCGVRRAPSAVVASAAQDLWERSQQFNQGQGCIWSGDSRDGINGGGEFVRWIRARDEADQARKFFANHCDRIRIMPFLEGIPCSIHGIVCPDYVIALRPCEMLVLRDRDAGKFLYAGVSTLWDPHPDDRAYMRELAKTVGHALRDLLAYRGAFTIDGVMTVDGFVPVELNPRFGAGLMRIETAIDLMPLELVDLLIREGIDYEFHPRELESLVLSAADEKRSASSWACLHHVAMTDHRQINVRQRGSTLSVAAPSDLGNAQIVHGPAPVENASILSFTPDRAELQIGSSFAPLVLRSLSLAAEHLAFSLPRLESAVVVR